MQQFTADVSISVSQFTPTVNTMRG